MAYPGFEKGTKKWKMFVDFWEICQIFWEPQDKDEYWDFLIKKTGQFMQEYEDEIFAQKIALALIESLEEKYKKMKG